VDQMVQAARSGRQNIAEGSRASATSSQTELRLLNVARASLEELRRDYEDFLRQRDLPQWERNDPRHAELIARRPATADDVARWARDVKNGQDGSQGQHGPHGQGDFGGASTGSTPGYPEIAANGVLALLAVACSLLDRQINAQAAAFEKEGGFTERLYRRRSQSRQQKET